MAFKIIRNDITKVMADAIVNTANPDPDYAAGVDAAIYAAAGTDALLHERKKIGEMNVGQAAVTPAFALDAKYIIHTVGPAWVDGKHGEFADLRSCYVNSLNLAQELGCESIAFPLIATGVYGFPKAEALRTAISVFSDFLLNTDMEIILVVFDKESFVLSDKIFSDIDIYIDEKYASEQIKEEYGSEAAYESLSGKRSGRLFQDRWMARKAYKANLYAEGSFISELTEDEETEEAVEEEQYVDNCEEEVDEDYDDNECLEDVPPMAAPVAMSASAFSDDHVGLSLDERVSHVADTWQESLLHIIDEKGYTDTEVYKRANVDRKLFSKIRGNTAYQPKKITAVAFALALKLNLDETKDLLGRAGYALSPSSIFDLIIEYFIEHGVYDTYTINLALFEHDQPILGE
ncbi:MAG: macro domain-containing protein [Lachnospiraceae bacterium]|nr:macro domain-containing protein [Lachnospiraceae bacterium]